MQFAYTFFVWPDETWKWNNAVYFLFERLKGRLEFVFTEEQFERFRSDLSHHGLTMREIERVPHVAPESVE